MSSAGPREVNVERYLILLSEFVVVVEVVDGVEIVPEEVHEEVEEDENVEDKVDVDKRMRYKCTWL